MYLTSEISPLPFSKRARFNAATWQGRRWPAYDPNGEVTWNEWAVKHAVTTDTDITAEYGGNRNDNIATVRQEMKDEKDTPISDRFLSTSAMSAKMAANGDPNGKPIKPETKEEENGT